MASVTTAPAPSTATAPTSSASQYKKHTHREHILELPDTYIGSVDTSVESRWILNTERNAMEWRTVRFTPGFYKLFDEILVNALDHRVRMGGRVGTVADAVAVKHIDVTLSGLTIKVRNDGDGIPVDKHGDSGIWAPELIFGNLLTSSNYDKGEEKVVGGKNGYGAKLANIFSRVFTVETVDHRAKKRYHQTWQDNMTRVGIPKMSPAVCKPFTEITYTPDLARFHWGTATVPTEIPEDMLAIMRTRVYDAAACAGKDCRISLNGVVLTANTFPKYMDLYLSDTDGSTTSSSAAGGGGAAGKKRVAFEVAGTRWEVGAVLTRSLHGDVVPDERHISFVNGIATRRGGKHVEYVTKEVLSSFCEYAKKKAKIDVTPALLKDAVVWFINCTIVNPSFDTQTKETLTTPVGKFGSKPEITSKFVETLAKLGLLEEAEALLHAKTARDVKKTDGKKRSTVRGIPKLDDATYAGTPKSAECTLILTEGDSAKTTAISGLKVVGRENYGVFPLKGKILNVKDISADKKMKNQELTYLKQILGLETGRVYTDLKQLRYGRIMIMTDQDVDGSHIKGLLMNLFHTEWPSLLKLGFLCCLMTPLLKATRGSTTLCFYSESEYEAWKLTLGDAVRGWHTKYYKGLGTSTAAEARDYFTSMNTIEYIWDEKSSDGAIDLAFNKKRADDRKTWLATFDRKRHLEVTAGGAKVDYARFVNDELIHFSNEDNIRSLPNVMDGLKPSQRKIFWAALKRNLTSEIRVAQLAGYVSEKASYHHGEASLTGAIVGMAQTFVGSNNLNLLTPNGQFGTRLMGGDDCASARYIHTELNRIVRQCVKKEDDAILEYAVDDGTPVEPVTYMPTVPMLLVNGARGIGTGFSTEVLPYNPDDIIRVLEERLNGSLTTLADTDLTPWWFGFKGAVEAGVDKKSWITRGSYTFLNDDKALIRITELPVGVWTQDYKDFLEGILVAQESGGSGKKGSGSAAEDGKKEKEKEPVEMMLRGYTANYNDVDVDFTLEMDPDYYHTARAYPAEFESKFKMFASHKSTNMTAFDTAGKIRKFGSTGEILEMFYMKRIAMYGVRKAHELARMDAELVELTARLTFLRAVVEGRLVVANRSDDELLGGLRGLALPALSEGEGLRGYEYLLKLRIDRIKASAVAELVAELEAARAVRDCLFATSVAQLWLNDLEEFKTAWRSYSAERTTVYTSTPSDSPAKKKVVRKPAAAKTAAKAPTKA